MAEKITNTPKQLAKLRLTQKEGAQLYTKLRTTVMTKDLLRRSYGYYAVLAVLTLSGFSFAVYNLFTQTNYFILFFWSLVLIIFTIQLGGFMHDAGHRCITKSSKWNDVIGYVACALLAAKFSTWRTKHNAHHAHTNVVDEDPDLELPLSFTDDRFKGATGIKGFIRKYQMYLYFPLGLLVAFSFRFTGVKGFVSGFTPKMSFELVVFLAGLFAWFVLPFLLFDPAKALFLFFVIHPLLGLYLMTIFAPNHKGMTQFGKNVRISFIEQQVLSSRNINGGIVTDFLFLGLNYQIEHHLFPNCPRNKLHKITPFVQKLCKQNHLTYTSVSVFRSNKIILQDLQYISKLDNKAFAHN